jgi:hypothetical protein
LPRTRTSLAIPSKTPFCTRFSWFLALPAFSEYTCSSIHTVFPATEFGVCIGDGQRYSRFCTKDWIIDCLL